MGQMYEKVLHQKRSELLLFHGGKRAHRKLCSKAVIACMLPEGGKEGTWLIDSHKALGLFLGIGTPDGNWTSDLSLGVLIFRAFPFVFYCFAQFGSSGVSELKGAEISNQRGEFAKWGSCLGALIPGYHHITSHHIHPVISYFNKQIINTGSKLLEVLVGRALFCFFQCTLQEEYWGAATQFCACHYHPLVR